MKILSFRPHISVKSRKKRGGVAITESDDEKRNSLFPLAEGVASVKVMEGKLKMTCLFLTKKRRIDRPPPPALMSVCLYYEMVRDIE